MHITVILRILGVLLMLFSFTMVPPGLVALLYNDGGEIPFFSAFMLIFLSGLICWLPFYNRKTELRVRDGFVVVVMFWTVLALFGATPLLLSDTLSISFTDAVFESLSGLTTTGATVIVGLDELPRSILFYRQQLQWLGGMGIIVLAVAILPMLGIGGMQLYRAETPGPVKESKLTPRITETAKALWYIYLSLTITCALAYWFAGMDAFDAICHSFSTIAIGGFSTHDMSIGHFNSIAVDTVAVVFMIIAAANFALHFTAWRRRSIGHYFVDPEFRFFLFLLLTVAAISSFGLIVFDSYDNPAQAIRYGIFETVSIATTTGFATADYAAWPSFIPVILIFASFSGGCAGSTAGGIKAIRTLLLFLQGLREIRRLIHPNAIFLVKLGRKPVSDRVIESVWGFVSAYIFVFAVLLIAIMATGLDFQTAFSAVAACINNLGPGMGDVAEHYGNVSDTAKWILCFAMLLGRLEVFTLLVLFTPMFWRR